MRTGRAPQSKLTVPLPPRTTRATAERSDDAVQLAAVPEPTTTAPFGIGVPRVASPLPPEGRDGAAEPDGADDVRAAVRVAVPVDREATGEADGDATGAPVGVTLPAAGVTVPGARAVVSSLPTTARAAPTSGPPVPQAVRAVAATQAARAVAAVRRAERRAEPDIGARR
jgi:hypothetical protein